MQDRPLSSVGRARHFIRLDSPKRIKLLEFEQWKHVVENRRTMVQVHLTVLMSGSRVRVPQGSQIYGDVLVLIAYQQVEKHVDGNLQPKIQKELTKIFITSLHLILQQQLLNCAWVLLTYKQKKQQVSCGNEKSSQDD